MKMTKMFNFSVNEISGRTFELPYEKAIEIIKENYPNEDNIDLDNLEEYEIARLLWNFCFDDIEEHELDNDTFESTIDETKIYETTRQVA